MTTVRRDLRDMEYGPAPEGEAPAHAWLDAARSAVRAVHRRCAGPSRRARLSTSCNPATGKPLAPADAGPTAGDVDRRGARGAQGAARVAGARRPRACALPVRARARGAEAHARLFAVLETLDNGKTIRETRDIDVPLVARHFYHHAGWAQLHRAASSRPRAGRASSGRSSRGTSRCSCWRGRSRPHWRRETRSCSSPPSSRRSRRCCFAELCEEIGLPAGVINIVTGDGRTGEALVDSPGRRQDRVHRVDRGRADHPQRDRGKRQEAVARAGREVAVHRLSTTPISTAWSKAWSTRSGSIRARSAAPARGMLVQEGVADRLVAKLRARMETLRVGDPLDKAVDMGAIVAPVQLERIQGLVDAGEEEGADDVAALVGCPPEGGSSRRRCSPTCARRRRSRRSRSSDRCSCR